MSWAASRMWSVVRVERFEKAEKSAAMMVCSISAPEKFCVAWASFARSNWLGSRFRFRRWMAKISRRAESVGRSRKKISSNRPFRMSSAGRFEMSLAVATKNGLEDSLTFYAFPMLDARKISSSNMLERLNKEFRRRSKVVTVFPSMGVYLRLLTTYVMECTEDWQKMGRAYLDLSSLQNYVR